MGGFVELCPVAAIGEGESLGFDPQKSGNDSLFVLRYKGRLYAWKNSCPHINGAPMAWRKDRYLNADATHIVCFAHGAMFDPATGLCTKGACMGKHLEPVELIESADGKLFARVTGVK